MSRFILIRETGSKIVTVVDRQNGTAEDVDAATLGLESGDRTDAEISPGIAAAVMVADGADFSSQYHYRA